MVGAVAVVLAIGGAVFVSKAVERDELIRADKPLLPVVTRSNDSRVEAVRALSHGLLSLPVLILTGLA